MWDCFLPYQDVFRIILQRFNGCAHVHAPLRNIMAPTYLHNPFEALFFPDYATTFIRISEFSKSNAKKTKNMRIACEL